MKRLQPYGEGTRWNYFYPLLVCEVHKLKPDQDVDASANMRALAYRIRDSAAADLKFSMQTDIKEVNTLVSLLKFPVHNTSETRANVSYSGIARLVWQDMLSEQQRLRLGQTVLFHACVYKIISWGERHYCEEGAGSLQRVEADMADVCELVRALPDVAELESPLVFKFGELVMNLVDADRVGVNCVRAVVVLNELADQKLTTKSQERNDLRTIAKSLLKKLKRSKTVVIIIQWSS
jgi:hypothetical protein